MTDTTGPTATEIAALRAAALLRAGLVAEAATVVQGAAGRWPTDAAAGVLAARIGIAAGDATRGCAPVKSVLGRKSELAKPQRAEALALSGYCAAVAGNPSGAGLAAELMREERHDDAGLLAVLDAAASGGAGPVRLADGFGPLHYRLAMLAGGVQDLGRIERADPAGVAMVAADPAAPPALRVIAAEAAARLDTLPPSGLAEVYRAAAVSTSNGEAAPSPQPAPALVRAAAFRTAEVERTPLKKVRAIRSLLDDARRAGLYWQTLAMVAPVEAVLQPVPEIGWFAESGIEIALVAGNVERARQWAALGGAVPGDGGLRHWLPLIDLVDPSLRGERGRSLASVEALAVRGRLSAELLHRLATVLDANDIAVPIPLWEATSRAAQPTGGHLPDTGVLTELKDAAAKSEHARVVLLAMRTIGPGGADAANVIALGDVIRALRRAGLDADARRLSLEALFAQWPRGAIDRG